MKITTEPVVTNLLSSLGESGDFLAVKTLKDANDKNRYSYLPFSSGGYLIYDSEFYDIYKNQKYVPSSLESGDGVALIEHLRDYIDGDVLGSVTGDVFTGIMSYCSKQGVSHLGGFDGYNDNYVIGRVDSYGIPFLLNIHNHPT